MPEPIITSEASSGLLDFTSNSRIICRVCEKQFSQYTCPKCNTRYCSLPCYKVHSFRCTESFMRENVMEEMQHMRPDEQSKRKMIDILKRFHEEEESESMDEDDLNSSLSEETIQKFLLGDDLNIDDLSIEEKKRFQRAITSGELSKMIEPWEPWWLKPSAKHITLSSNGTQLIQPIQKEDHVTSSQDQVTLSQDIPPGPENPLQPVSKLTSSKPSPLLSVHLIDIIYTYSFTLRLYNGDWKSDPLESVMVVSSVSSVLSHNEQPETVLEALCHCLEKVSSPTYKDIGGAQFGLSVVDDVISLLRLGTGGLVCLLCDMQRMVESCERELKSEKLLKKEKRLDLKKKVKFAQRKIYFLTCWVYEQPSEVWDSLADIVKLEKSSSMEYAEGIRENVREVENTKGVVGKPLIKEMQ